jgi:hypothetical protein
VEHVRVSQVVLQAVLLLGRRALQVCEQVQRRQQEIILRGLLGAALKLLPGEVVLLGVEGCWVDVKHALHLHQEIQVLSDRSDRQVHCADGTHGRVDAVRERREPAVPEGLQRVRAASARCAEL